MGWHRSLFDVVNKARTRGLVIYGAGYWGKIARRIFERYGVSPLCYADDDENKAGTVLGGMEIRTLRDCKAEYENAVYVVCVAEGASDLRRLDMIANLKALGLYSDESEMRIPFYYFALFLNTGETIKDRLEDDRFKYDDDYNLCVFCNMSNSGSYYLEQRLDSHPQILFVPFLESLYVVYERRLKYLSGDELIYEIMAQMCGYFSSPEELPLCIKDQKFGKFVVDKNGGFIEELLVDPQRFYLELKLQLEDVNTVRSYGQLIKTVYAAYNNTTGRKKDPHAGAHWCFYNEHTPNYDVTLVNEQFDAREFKRIEVLTIIREPLNHIYSWVNYAVINGRQYKSCKRELFRNIISCDLGYMMEKKEGISNSRAICFEDLKLYPDLTMQALCRWMGIAYHNEILNVTTTNGIEVFFPSRTEKKLVTGNDRSAVSRKDISDIIPEEDRVRLEVFFKRFKDAYGYDSPAKDMERYSIEELKEMLRDDFKFARIVNDFVGENMPVDGRYDVNEMIRGLFEEFIDSHYGKNTEYYSKISKEEAV
ncbi:MAG: hypothetical protein K6F34_05855 [Lachnospiraceae bacterium]|nr:hypothetical protein [Lachnospiraceae bacterium]